MAKAWYYKKDGVRHGPVASTELRALAKAGVLSPSDPVWKEGMSQAVRASQLRGLYDVSSVSQDHTNDGLTSAKEEPSGLGGEEPVRREADTQDPTGEATSGSVKATWQSQIIGRLQVGMRTAALRCPNPHVVRAALESPETRTRLARSAAIGVGAGLAYSLLAGRPLFFCVMGALTGAVLDLSSFRLHFEDKRNGPVPARFIGAILVVLVVSGFGQGVVGRMLGSAPTATAAKRWSWLSGFSEKELSVTVGTANGSSIARNLCNPCLTNVRASVSDSKLHLRFDLVEERAKQNRSLPLPLLIRVFDGQGSYLLHFITQEQMAVTEEAYDVYMDRYRQQQMLPDMILARMAEKDRYREPTLLVPKGNVFSYTLPAEVAAQVASVEVGFWQQAAR